MQGAKKNLLHLSDRNIKPNKYNFFYYLDCISGEGLNNPLLSKLKEISKREFKVYLNFILKKCIYVNRSFSDAVELFSIWIEKSPDSLLEKLKNAELKRYFNRTEYDHDGDQWYFPKLLQVFSILVQKKQVTENEVLNYLFETLDFFSMPEIFVREIIGYDRLELCVKESPSVFKQALLLKVHEFIDENKKIDMGSRSRKYLKDEIQAIDEIKRIKTELSKQTQAQELIAYIKQNGGLFHYPSINYFDQDQFRNHKFNFRG